MKIAIEYFGPAREAAGCSRETVEICGPSSAREVIKKVALARGGKFASLLLTPDGEISTSVLLAIGNRQVAFEDAIELRDGDEIVVIPPVSGGC